MNRELFEFGITELKNYFHGFRPTKDQVETWFGRVAQFGDESLRLAVYTLSTGTDRAPSFREIRAAIIAATQRLARAPKITVDGGAAPRTREMLELTRHYMALLKDAPKMTSAERTELKARWELEYKRLPGYTSEAEIRKIVAAKDWAKLIFLGVIFEPPPEGPYFPPIFESEKNNSYDSGPGPEPDWY